MVGRTVVRTSLIAIALLGARSVSAGPITFTGNVANDFNPLTTPGVVTITDSIHENDPIHIAQPSWMTSSGLVSGWNIKDVALYYNAATDTMYVGVNTYGVAGNVDGNGTPGSPDPRLTAAGGTDPANFGGDKAMVVGFAPLTGTYNPANLPAPVIVAGVSGDKATQTGPGLDGFNVANYVGGTTPGTINLLTGFGTDAHGRDGQSGLRSQPGAPRLRVHDHQLQQTPGRQSRQRARRHDAGRIGGQRHHRQG